MRIRLNESSAVLIAKLHPDLKRMIRAGLDELSEDSEIGKPLEDELSGLRSYRVHGFRIIYQMTGRGLEVIAIGPRSTIYQDMLGRLKAGKI